jgi:hypothetical protein
MQTSEAGLVELCKWPGYAVNLNGDIFSLNFNQQKYTRKLHSVRKPSGYLQVTLCKEGKRLSKRINRIMAEQFLPDFSENLQVNHINGIKTDNSLMNLEMTTPKENMVHAVKLGLHDVKGSNHPQAKLNEDQVGIIKELLKTSSKSQVEIAKEFNVTKYTISLIFKNKIWKHVGESI